MAIDPTLQKIYEALEEHVKTGALDKLNDTPDSPVAAISGSGSGNKFMQRSDLIDMRDKMLTKSESQLMAIWSEQTQRRDVGVPLESWVGRQGNTQAIYQAIQSNEMLLRAVDSAGAAPLIRQDLDPVVHALFVKRFPGWERFRKTPANGLVHAFNQQLTYGDAQFISELGTVVDDQNTYNRATAPISVLARRIGVGLKASLAVQAGGAGYDLQDLELQGGLTAMAHKLQKTIFQGNATASGGTADDENGLYDANAFDGLRLLLKSNTNDVNIDISSATLANRASVTDGINLAASNISDAGGNPSVVYSRFAEHTEWNRQNTQFVRIINAQDRVNFVPGVDVTAIATNVGILPFVGVPGDSIGFYDYSGKDNADIYVLDESGWVMPYLGSDTVTTIEIPMGVGGQLVRYFIVYIMVGLAQLTPPFSAKVRARFEA